ncbi:MAG: hypothetical protein GTO60_08475, partial [Gammaproteobacteria bacterium]|nr:hypothetical protein [Gammaproteobacteria bacterium]
MRIIINYIGYRRHLAMKFIYWLIFNRWSFPVNLGASSYGPMRRMKRPLCFILLLCVSDFALAADMNPPDWRGQEGSTYQQWEFGFEEVSGGISTDPECAHLNFIQTQQVTQQATPDVMKNPYQETSGICVEF